MPADQAPSAVATPVSGDLFFQERPHLLLDRPRQRAYLTPASLEGAALHSTRDHLVEAGIRSEAVAEFVMRRAEASGGGGLTPGVHWRGCSRRCREHRSPVGGCVACSQTLSSPIVVR